MVKNGLPAIHPGEFLAEILGEMGISQAEFARSIGVSPMRISHVIKGAPTFAIVLLLQVAAVVWMLFAGPGRRGAAAALPAEQAGH